jgi:hypothetical protein
VDSDVGGGESMDWVRVHHKYPVSITPLTHLKYIDVNEINKHMYHLVH